MHSNPNGANGVTSDPREKVCWDNYVKSIAEGRENAYQSAIDAGYEECTARQITVRSWFIARKSKLKQSEIISKAERNLEKLLDSEDERIKADLTKFTLSRLKKEDYSDRVEHTGKEGNAIEYNLITNEQAERIIARRLSSVTSSIEE